MGGTKRDFVIFSNEFRLLSKKSATKFLCVKTSSRKVVATSFLYLTVQRRIVGDVPIYQKFALKVNHPFKKCRFRHISLNSATAVSASEKVQLSLIGSRQRAFHRAIDEPCALPLSPPKSGLKREFLHLALPFISSLQVIVDTSNLVCGLLVCWGPDNEKLGAIRFCSSGVRSSDLCHF